MWQLGKVLEIGNPTQNREEITLISKKITFERLLLSRRVSAFLVHSVHRLVGLGVLGGPAGVPGVPGSGVPSPAAGPGPRGVLGVPGAVDGPEFPRRSAGAPPMLMNDTESPPEIIN